MIQQILKKSISFIFVETLEVVQLVYPKSGNQQQKRACTANIRITIKISTVPVKKVQTFFLDTHAMIFMFYIQIHFS